MSDRSRSLLLGCAVFALAAVAVALVLQHVFDMRPCAWCVFQRLLYLLVAAFALVGLAFGSVGVRRAFAALSVLAALGGVWAALHQQLVAAQTQSCAFTFADRVLMQLRLDETLPWLFFADASCSEANVPLLGVPFALWSVAAFVLLAAGASFAALSSKAPRARRSPLPEVPS
ncbi:MAG: disulfide bond formation protein B [Burkholderiaceae bacterium]|nr:disulfide bond formation protein B [Burkholderiaceae bacterium]